MHRFLATLGLVLTACGGGTSEPRDPYDEPITDGRGASPTAAAPPSAPAAADPGQQTDAPEISRSRGDDDSVVVLWPRIVVTREMGSPDADTLRLARAVQDRLADVVRRALPNRTVDVRPKPERVCPDEGCVAPSVGALLARAGNGCSVVALVSPPGRSPAKLIPWTGEARTQTSEIPFRKHAENYVEFPDMGSCKTLTGDLAEGEAQVEEAVRGSSSG